MDTTTTATTRPSRCLRGAAFLLVAAAGAAFGTGCVSQQTYDDLYAAHASAEEQRVALQRESTGRDSEFQQLRSQLQLARDQRKEAQSLNATTQRELDDLRGDFQRLADRLNRASVRAIDPATDRALRNLAVSNAGLMTYNAELGVVRLASDLTFASGSDELTGEAGAGIDKLADVLKGAGGRYDVRIIGHTDSVRIGNPRTKAKHPTNMHLSAHRAISVFNRMRSAGMPVTQMEIAGRGPHQPAVLNPAKGGAKANRRVELFLVPAALPTAAPTPANQPAVAPEPVKPLPAEPLK